MIYTFSEHDLWGPDKNVVCVLPPCKSDVIIATLVNGKIVWRHAATEHQRAVWIANACAHRIRGPRGVVIKVMGLSLQEAETFGVLPREEQPAASERLATDRQLVTCTLWTVVREEFDPALKAEALKVLEDIGELPCS